MSKEDFTVLSEQDRRELIELVEDYTRNADTYDSRAAILIQNARRILGAL